MYLNTMKEFFDNYSNDISEILQMSILRNS